MKLAPLLSQYLYTNKRLDLPGIGTFLLGSKDIIEQENGKNLIASNISFESNSSLKESPDLIKYISSQTGKMKALAIADLDSHLEQARQFLNIGKPFLFEGIGNLVKIRSGEFAFTSGETISDKIKEYSAREISSTSSTEESFDDIYPKEKRKWRKPVTLLLLLAGIGLAIWGGYTVYKKNSNKEILSTSIAEKQNEKGTLLITDSSQLTRKDNDSIQEKSIVPENYRFVIEVANKQRGLDRFATLKGFGLDVKMDTTDSPNYKLFFLLPAASSDTAKMIDSLRNLYTPVWAKAFVEK